MKIDAHQHFWNYDSEKYSWIGKSMRVIQKDFLPPHLKPVLKKNNIDACVSVQADQSEDETNFLLYLAAQHDFIRGVVGWVNLNAENVEERLRSFSKNPIFKGVRHTVFDEAGEFMTDLHFRNGIEKLHKFNLTYDLLVFDYQLPAAIQLAREFPKQTFVLDHLGKPGISSEGPSEAWIANIQELANCSNVYCKLSGLVTETPDFKWQISSFSPFLDVVVAAFGTNRLIVGSDWPVCLPAASYKDTLDIVESYFSSYPEAEKKKIFGETACEIYNL